ncbi:MAG: FkbM family methyltransferase [Vicinamibacterales bacterium]
MRAIQRLLLAAYALACRLGLLRLPGASRIVLTAYEAYKRRIEAPFLPGMAPLVTPGSLALDIGANVGFFTEPFARWAGPEGRVIAVEPDPANFAALAHRVSSRGLATTVTLVEAAAAATAGPGLTLAQDPDHPGNHRLAPDGLPVRGVTVDELVARVPDHRVSLIKIDVQGAELLVLRGAAQTLARHRPALLVEIDDDALRALGASAGEVCDYLAGAGYAPHAVSARGVGEPLARGEVVERSARGEYLDVLFVSGAATGGDGPRG